MGDASTQRTRNGARPPALYEFITVRQERFGALVFNPFLGAERAFGPPESAVISAIDGRRDPSMLARALAEELSLPLENARTIVDATLSQLSSLCALDDAGGYISTPPRAVSPT
jgi:hypothetical protein